MGKIDISVAAEDILRKVKNQDAETVKIGECPETDYDQVMSGNEVVVDLTAKGIRTSDNTIVLTGDMENFIGVRDCDYFTIGCGGFAGKAKLNGLEGVTLIFPKKLGRDYEDEQ